MHNPEILLQQSENAFADAMKARREGQTMESWPLTAEPLG